MPSWVGDCIMATPFLRALHINHPDHHITLLMRPGLENILAGLPFINHIETADPRSITEIFRAAKHLKSQNFNIAILLPNSFRTALIPFLARIPNRIGYARDGRSIFLSRAISCPHPNGWKHPYPAVEYYLNLAVESNLITEPLQNIDKRLQIQCTGEDKTEALNIFHKANINPDQTRIAILNPGGNRADKRWPVDRFVELGKHLARQHNLTLLVNGSPAEIPLINSICNKLSAETTVHNLPKLGISLKSLKYICKCASIIITNDTGTRHIAVASAFDNPTPIRIITLFGPTDPAWTTLNYPHETEITAGKSPAPITNITLQQVINTCDKLLNNNPLAN